MTDKTNSLAEIEKAAKAILLLLLDAAKQAERPKSANSLEGLLYRAGFTTQADIVAITGTPSSTVSARLKEEGLT